MKTRVLVYIFIIATIVGGIMFIANNKDVRNKISSLGLSLVGGEWSYIKHHEPTPGCYYSVDSISTASGGKTFIIGKNVRPEIGGTVSEIGDLREIEIPKKKAGTTIIRKGSFFIVRDVNGESAAVFFPDAKAVVTDALRH